jgi:hypothetical protein
MNRLPPAASRWSRIWPWLALAAVAPLVLGLAFAGGFFIFGGGWGVLPAPWSSRVPFLLAVLIAAIAIARWQKRRTAADDEQAPAQD